MPLDRQRRDGLATCFVGQSMAPVSSTKKKFAILEASDRMGGRCFTDTTTFNLPYDRGACSIHLPAQCSLAKLAGQNGTELYPDPERQRFRVRGRNGLEKDLEENRSKLELEEFYAERVRCYAAIAQAVRQGLPADLEPVDAHRNVK